MPSFVPCKNLFINLHKIAETKKNVSISKQVSDFRFLFWRLLYLWPLKKSLESSTVANRQRLQKITGLENEPNEEQTPSKQSLTNRIKNEKYFKEAPAQWLCNLSTHLHYDK